MEAVVNQNMKNPPMVVGVITPPNTHYKPVLYSHTQATKDFKKLNQDLYVAFKKQKPQERHKTPQSVYWFLGIGALAISFPFLKKLIKK